MGIGIFLKLEAGTLVLTNNASRPGPVDEGLPEGAVWLADDLGRGRGVVVVLEELAFWAVVLQDCADRDSRVTI